MQINARGTLAAVLLTARRFPEALAETRRAIGLLTSLGKFDEAEAIIRLAYAEALFATGDHKSARAAIADARDKLLAAAARIDDPRWRHSFLHNVSENARTLELARAWLGDDSA